MNGDRFIDTNILVYAHDTTDPHKHAVCRVLVDQVFRGEQTACISNQVLAEFFSVVTGRVAHPLPPKEASAIVADVEESVHWGKLQYTTTTVRAAAESAAANHLHFWDALIAETMKEHDLSTIYTENITDFSRIPGIRAVNPLATK